MRLCAIYCIWDDFELFKHSYRNIADLVDGVILIYSNTSNFGELSDNKLNLSFKFDELVPYNWEPDLNLDARTNETNKRNFGLQVAKDNRFTHFLFVDADEFYEPQAFLKEEERFKNDLNGLVCRVKCYFRTPELTIGYDTTLVPFIHKLTPEIKCEFNRDYPFAWTDTDKVPFTPEKCIRIDPTRSLNISSGVGWSEITMHHMSWIRSDVKKKIRNSTARQNIEKSTIVTDYVNAKSGYFCQFYQKRLEVAENIFNLPDIIDESLT